MFSSKVPKIVVEMLLGVKAKHTGINISMMMRFALALFPIIHLNSDEVVVKDKKANSRKLMKNLDTHGHSQSVSQAIFTEMDSVDVAKDGHKYNTNAVILVGCKVSIEFTGGNQEIFALLCRSWRLDQELQKVWSTVGNLGQILVC